MSDKVKVQLQFEEIFLPAKVTVTDTGFKFQVTEIQTSQFEDVAHIIQTFGSVKVSSKRSGKGITIIVTV